MINGTNYATISQYFMDYICAPICGVLVLERSKTKEIKRIEINEKDSSFFFKSSIVLHGRDQLLAGVSQDKSA
jgi:S-adenosylmethionine hydrolase